MARKSKKTIKDISPVPPPGGPLTELEEANLMQGYEDVQEGRTVPLDETLLDTAPKKPVCHKCRYTRCRAHR